MLCFDSLGWEVNHPAVTRTRLFFENIVQLLELRSLPLTELLPTNAHDIFVIFVRKLVDFTKNSFTEPFVGIIHGSRIDVCSSSIANGPEDIVALFGGAL